MTGDALKPHSGCPVIQMSASGTSANSNTAGLLAYVPSDPPTAADWQALADKVTELIAALRR